MSALPDGPTDREPSEGGEVPDAGPGAQHANPEPSVSSGDADVAVDDAARGAAPARTRVPDGDLVPRPPDPEPTAGARGDPDTDGLEPVPVDPEAGEGLA